METDEQPSGGSPAVETVAMLRRATQVLRRLQDRMEPPREVTPERGQAE
jgi:hypothetical protein